jgi:hypothetical protein
VRLQDGGPLLLLLLLLLVMSEVWLLSRTAAVLAHAQGGWRLRFLQLSFWHVLVLVLLHQQVGHLQLLLQLMPCRRQLLRLLLLLLFLPLWRAAVFKLQLQLQLLRRLLAADAVTG